MKKEKIILLFGLIFVLGIIQFSSSVAVFSEPDEPLFGIQSFSIFNCTDGDGDDVCDFNDDCPNSRQGERIDNRGCDPFQFCNQYNCGPMCNKADFLNNEQYKKFPGDCTTVVISKEGSYYPKCVPLKCEKQLNIPSGYINFSIKKGQSSYLNVTLWGVPEGYAIFDGTWMGWCADNETEIQIQKKYRGRFYSTYDPNLATKCPACVNPNWTKINYIINNKKGTKEDVQHAIWYFTDGIYPHPSKPLAREMVEEAKLYGEDFWPQSGQFMAIIIYVNERIQLIFIEVDP